MLLSDIFIHLAHGALSQYAAGTNDAGTIAEKDYPKIISFINLGLSQLHTDLPLRMEQVTVQLDPCNTKYTLHSKNACSVSGGGYLLDSCDDPFDDNILLIDEVFSEDGEEIPLNQHNVEGSFFTPKYNELQVPNPEFKQVAVLYRADHPKLPMTQRLDPTQVEVQIPSTLLTALCTLVKAAFLSGQGSAEGIQESSLAMQKYYSIIETIKNNGLVHQDAYDINLFRRNGWV